MVGFEPRISGVEGDCFTKRAITTSQKFTWTWLSFVRYWPCFGGNSVSFYWGHLIWHVRFLPLLHTIKDSNSDLPAHNPSVTTSSWSRNRWTGLESSSWCVWRPIHQPQAGENKFEASAADGVKRCFRSDTIMRMIPGTGLMKLFRICRLNLVVWFNKLV